MLQCLLPSVQFSFFFTNHCCQNFFFFSSPYSHFLPYSGLIVILFLLFLLPLNPPYPSPGCPPNIHEYCTSLDEINCACNKIKSVLFLVHNLVYTDEHNNGGGDSKLLFKNIKISGIVAKLIYKRGIFPERGLTERTVDRIKTFLLAGCTDSGMNCFCLNEIIIVQIFFTLSSENVFPYGPRTGLLSVQAEPV